MSLTDIDPVFELVVPAHDEEEYLRRCISELVPVLDELPVPTRIVIVDSGSTDRTWSLAQSLALLEGVRAMRVDEAGRGRALRAAWSVSTAAYVGYTDVDLSGDIRSLSSMLDLVRTDAADVVIASRLHVGARVRRRASRELMSRAYGELIQWVAAPPFLDSQCGLKLMRGDLCRRLLTDVEDERWFFDTELLLLAWVHGERIIEVPVTWVERVRSTVDVPKTVVEDLSGLARVGGASVCSATRHVAGRGLRADAGIARAVRRESAGLLALSAATTRASEATGVGCTARSALLGVALGTWLVRPASLRPQLAATPMMDASALAVGVATWRVCGGGSTARRVVLACRAALAAARLVFLSSWRIPTGVTEPAGRPVAAGLKS